MQIQPAVLKETRRIALGTGILSLIMIAVFLVIRQFDYTVILGALLGNLMAVGNFFLLALSVQKAAEQMNGVKLPPLPETPEGEEAPETSVSPEAKQASKKMQLSYTLRLLGIAMIAVIAIKLPCFHSLAALIPLLFPRLVIFIMNFVQNNKREA